MPRRNRRTPPEPAGAPDTSRANLPAVPPRARPPAPPERDPAPAGVTPGLSARDERIALAIATGRSQAEAARLTGAGVRTVYDVIRRPPVAARIAEVRRELMAETMSSLVGLGSEAVAVMADLMRDNSGDVAPAVRLWAAQAVLSHTLRIAEHVNLKDELGELRRQLADLQATR